MMDDMPKGDLWLSMPRAQSASPTEPTFVVPPASSPIGNKTARKVACFVQAHRCSGQLRTD